jgi:hypothetical protein
MRKTVAVIGTAPWTDALPSSARAPHARHGNRVGNRPTARLYDVGGIAFVMAAWWVRQRPNAHAIARTRRCLDFHKLNPP